MTVSAINQYRIHDGKRDEFLNAVRATYKLIESLGGKPVLRQSLVGGELTGVQSSIVQFPNAVARGAYMDAITKPENVAKNALNNLVRAGGVTLVGRLFLNETPATDDFPTNSQVLGAARFRIAPGHLADGETALNAAKAARQAVGKTESHTYTVANGGASSGVRILSTHASSHKELAEIMDRMTAQNEGHGPLVMAIDAGVLIPMGSSVSTLVAL